MTKTKPVAGKRDFLSTLEDTFESLNNDLDSEAPRKKPGRVTFAAKVQKRGFLKHESPVDFEEEEEEDEQVYKARKQLEDDEDEEDEEGEEEEEEEEEWSEEDDIGSDEEEQSEEDDDDDEDDEDDDDDMESEDMDKNAAFNSLSPAEQLRLLMEPVEDEDEDTVSSEEEEMEDNEEEFFDEDQEFDNEENIPEAKSKANKKLRLSLDDDEDLEPEPMSNFEKAQARLQKTITALEEENISEKPWMLRGEVTAQHRPVNSLLEHDIDFEHVGRAAPVITEEVTESIENIIKQRIKDRAYDDVERRKITETAPPRKLPELDTERSSKSLSQVYEEEMTAAPVRESFPVDEHTKKTHEEITQLFGKICRKLDGLSNFMFAPRTYTLNEDIQIKSHKHSK
jgi:U3 small nucleolar RNA-associated protein MPP10